MILNAWIASYILIFFINNEITDSKLSWIACRFIKLVLPQFPFFEPWKKSTWQLVTVTFYVHIASMVPLVKVTVFFHVIIFCVNVAVLLWVAYCDSDVNYLSCSLLNALLLISFLNMSTYVTYPLGCLLYVYLGYAFLCFQSNLQILFLKKFVVVSWC